MQARLASILEDVIKASPIRGVDRLEIPRPLPTSFFAVRSEHSIILSSGSASCARCHLGVNGLPSLLKAWMSTSCPSPLTQVLGANTLTRPRPLSNASPTWLGGFVLHPSHRLYSYRGLVFCNVCGFVASKVPKKLKLPCGQDLPQCPTLQGASNLDRLWKGLLPHCSPGWPADKPHSSSIDLGSLPAG